MVLRQILKENVKVSIVVPVYNEEEVLERQLDFILRGAGKVTEDLEVIVVENGSSDNTRDLLFKLCQTRKKIKPLTCETSDYGVAMREGILRSSGKIIHICQVDFFDEKFFGNSLDEIEEGRIFVIGSRNRRGWDKRPFQRQILTFGLNLILNRFFHFKGTDTHGLKTFLRKDILKYVF